MTNNEKLIAVYIKKYNDANEEYITNRISFGLSKGTLVLLTGDIKK